MRILIADDDIEAMEGLITILREYGGHTVKQVSTVSEAETEFSGDSWDYDLFIVDVQIRPSLEEKEGESLEAGLTLPRKFRARFDNEKVLILTNNLHRVPTYLFRSHPNTKARDKVEVRGRRIVDLLRDW